jgi:hypothetical protein
LRPRGAGKPLRAFSFLEVAGEDDGASLDLAKLARGEPE